MVVECFFNGSYEKVAVNQSCFDRIESYYSEFIEHLKLCTVEDIDEVACKVGIVRARITSYITCIYDLGQFDYFSKSVLSWHYSDKITEAFENWLNTI